MHGHISVKIFKSVTDSRVHFDISTCVYRLAGSSHYTRYVKTEITHRATLETRYVSISWCNRVT